MGYQMQNPAPHHFKLENDTIKLEPSPIDSPLSSLSQTLPGPLPSISAWYDDNNSTRRSSTSSLSSCTLISELPSPVNPIGDLALNERASRRLSQLFGQLQPPAAAPSTARSTCDFISPYSSPGSTPGPENHVVRKSKAKAKTRAVRGVAKAADDLEPKPVELAQKEAKALREQDARFDQSVSHADLWQECKKTNPNFIREGVTRDGRRGLRQLKKNNIDHRIDRPNEINKEHLIDLSTICHRQFREIIIGEMNNHRFNGRYAEAKVLEEKFREVGTRL
ncbi:uncharacterized protein CC84DRAFT_1175092 [Paraphaeosphaeria sporulosa]|uniref:Uncharacterized protein n=1 Tax=Paraphaeosphaeria sporulosa TaxID=1460663 RepID=A0A177CI99_9PLEO|nr:uncharacterized protein CC84DRAFT_1175092 [Paraphaeosphaeria sporulosa]OAG07244.1 hypothetical protein CC84DRAFT_1175092 [Paraphaeosphaeria sporulosa]